MGFSAVTRYLWKAFLPSWRFFDEAGFAPHLEYRVGSSQNGLGEWKKALHKMPRKPHHVILNPQGNSALACHSLLQNVVQDLEDWDEKKGLRFQEMISYQLLKTLVIFQICEENPSLHDFYYQFKLCKSEDLLVSSIYGHKS